MSEENAAQASDAVQSILDSQTDNANRIVEAISAAAGMLEETDTENTESAIEATGVGISGQPLNGHGGMKPTKTGVSQYTPVDIYQEMTNTHGGKFSGLGKLNLSNLVQTFRQAFSPKVGAEDRVQNSGMVLNTSFNVTISGAGMDSRSAISYGKELANTAANSLFEALNRRGISYIQPLRQ